MASRANRTPTSLSTSTLMDYSPVATSSPWAPFCRYFRSMRLTWTWVSWSKTSSTLTLTMSLRRNRSIQNIVHKLAMRRSYCSRTPVRDHSWAPSAPRPSPIPYQGAARMRTRDPNMHFEFMVRLVSPKASNHDTRDQQQKCINHVRFASFETR